jgi:membrane protease YdiL (CAAX protease family)
VFTEFQLTSILTAGGYAAYILFTHSIFAETQIRAKLLKEKKSNQAAVLLHRSIGMIVYGLIPLLIVPWTGTHPLSDYGLIPADLNITFFWTIGLSALVIPVGILTGMNPFQQKHYPQIRLSDWNIRSVAVSAVSWTVYICAYEFLLRGLLFFSCWRMFGIIAAVFINIAVYALFHLHQSIREMLGALLFGAVLCASVYATENIWTAVGAHLALALSTEWSAIHFNPVMKMHWRIKPV